MTSLMIQLFQVFGPIVADIITKHRAANNGAMPTDAQMKAAFETNIDTYLAEGAAWTAAHPPTP